MGLFKSLKNKMKDNLNANSQALVIQDQLPNLDLLYFSDLSPKDIPNFGQGIVIEIFFENGIPY